MACLVATSIDMTSIVFKCVLCVALLRARHPVIVSAEAVSNALVTFGIRGLTPSEWRVWPKTRPGPKKHGWHGLKHGPARVGPMDGGAFEVSMEGRKGKGREGKKNLFYP